MNDQNENLNHHNITVADATEIVKSLEKSINSISDVVKGVDKKMHYNLKQFGELMNELDVKQKRN